MNAQDHAACPDPSRIVDVCSALDGDPFTALNHVVDCAECRAVIETLSALYRVQVAGADSTRSAAEVADRVSERLFQAHDTSARRTAGAPWSRWGIIAATWAVASITGFWGVLLMAGPGLGGGSLRGAAVAALLVGVIPFSQDLGTVYRTRAG